MKKHVYGLLAAYLGPIIVLTFGVMAFIAQRDIANALKISVLMMIGALGWHGGHNNVVKIAGGKLIVQNVYFIWKKHKKVDLEFIQKVVAKGGTRYGPITFTLFFKDGSIFEFRSGLINLSETRKLLSVIEKYGIAIETSRM